MDWWHFVVAALWLVLFRLHRKRAVRGADLGVASGASRDLSGRGGF